MFNFIKKKTKTNEAPAAITTETEATIIVNQPVAAEAPEKPKSLFAALRHGLKRTRSQLSSGLANLLLGEKNIDAALLGEIETQLLSADVGMAATQRIISEMKARVKRKELFSSEALFKALQDALVATLAPCNTSWALPHDVKPYVILVVGVNGAGKTTTIGKLAKQLQKAGKSVMLAAGDTFRAAAIEQLQVWGERNNIPVIAQRSGSDSASVVYDALAAAKARNIDVLIADTAGRLHTQSHLMEELKKIKRVLTKLDANAPHETMLVLDAGTGQNALRQAEQFNEAIKLTSVSITKLDGTAKGGMVFSLAETLKLPMRFVGVGEGIDDLQPFDARTFVEALFREND